MGTKNSRIQMEQLLLFPEESIYSSEERPARDSASRGNKEESAIQEARCASPMSDFLKQCAPAISSRKTSRAFSARTGGGILKNSSVKLMKSGILSHGECWTLNTCEWTVTLVPFLKEEGVCSLSDILETGDIPQRYYLSRRACQGILLRAESRGKKLPEILRKILEFQAEFGIDPE